MNTKYILVVGDNNNNADGLQQWMKTVRNAEVTTADTDERAIELASQQGYDMIILNGSNKELNVKKITALMPILQPDVIVLSYEGEPAVALYNKIETAFDNRKKERMKRLLVLDSSRPNFYSGLEPFSVN